MSEHAIRAHHPLGPSQLDDKLACLGKNAVEELIPENPFKDNTPADRGTIIHEISSENQLTGKPLEDWKGLTMLNQVITDDHIQEAKKYCDHIKEFEASHDVIHRFVEVSVSLDKFIAGCHGSLDYGAIYVKNNMDGLVLRITDLKTGRNYVPVEDNTQLKAYAAGLLSDPTFVSQYPELKEVQTIELCIFQGIARTWSLSRSDLLKFAQFVKSQVPIIMSGKAPRTPGEKQCKYCRFAPYCPELAASLTTVLIEEFDALDDPARVLGTSESEVERLMAMRPQIDALYKALETRIETELQDKDAWAGYYMGEGRRSREWTDEKEAEKFLKKQLKQDAYEKILLSPAKAEKLIPADQLAGLITVKKGRDTIKKLPEGR